MTKMTREEFYNLYRNRTSNSRAGACIDIEEEIKNVLAASINERDDYEDYLNDDLIIIAPRDED